MKKKALQKYLYWTPRILAILFILFIAMFALDVFSEDYTFWQTVIALFMHLVPNFILIIILVIAWKWEHIGGITYIVLGLLFILLTWQRGKLIGSLIVAGPPIIIGALFLWHHLRYNR